MNQELKTKELSEYWIGDRVKLKESNRTGTFEGISPSGKAQIKVDEKIILSAADNIEELEEEDTRKLAFPEEKKVDHVDVQQFNPEIDLHIEVLDPTLKNEIPQMIINKQVSACKNHIEQAISLGRREITIIHGKGLGQLKLEVDSLLASYDQVLYTKVIHQGGATAVGFKWS